MTASGDPDRQDTPRLPDKREDERIPLPGALCGEVMVFQSMTIVEISRGGLSIETSFPLQLDSLHDFRLILHNHSVVIKGRVAHSRISDVGDGQVTYRSGIQFVEPPDRTAGAIAGFVERLKDA